MVVGIGYLLVIYLNWAFLHSRNPNDHTPPQQRENLFVDGFGGS